MITDSTYVMCDNAFRRGCTVASWRYLDEYGTVGMVLWGYYCDGCAEREGHLVPYVEPITGTLEAAREDRAWSRTARLQTEGRAFFDLLLATVL